MIWTALVILQATCVGPVDFPPHHPFPSSPPPVTNSIGMQTVTTLNTPSSVLLRFDTKELCGAASQELSKKPGVQSVTCVQTGTP